MRSALDRTLPVLLLGLLALALAACGGGGAPVCVDEYIVNKTADTNDGACSADDCSLREAVLNANACPGWQTITLPAAGYPLTLAGANEDAAATGDLDITDDVTIVGEGAPSIDGNGLDRVFEVHAPAVVRMETLIVLDGQEQIGAGIRNHSELTLQSLSIQGNHAVVPPGGAGTSAGGGIFNETGTLTMTGTQVFENTADHGAGIHNFATARLESTGLLLALNVAAFDGGGLWNNMAAEAVLDDATLDRNSAPGKGAGIYNDGHLEINLATFEQNTDAAQGGGLYNQDGAEAFLYDAWFTNNSAVDGGAVWNEGLLHLYRSSLTINSALGGSGGGAYNKTPGALLLRNVTVSGNMASPAKITGGGIYNAGGEVRLEFATLAYNSPDGILNDGGGMVDVRSTILGHHALGNCQGVGSAGYNLADDGTCGLTEASDLPDTDGLLVWLDMNGGTNLSHALAPGSPAIDSGTPDLCTSEDQRSIARPQGAGCDRGALEMVGVAGAPAASPTPGPTPTEVATPTPAGVFGVLNKNAFCRRGPGTVYFDLGTFNQGQTLMLEGISPPGKPVWYWAQMPGGAGNCWISAAVLDVQGPTGGLAVTNGPSIPGTPTGLEIARRMCSQKQAYVVRLEWVDVSYETGYRVYRDGALLATLPAGETSYTENPPFGGPYTYAVEAFNKDAASPRATVVEEGCK